MAFKSGDWVIRKNSNVSGIANISLQQEKSIFSRARNIVEVQYTCEWLLEDEEWYLITKSDEFRYATEEEIEEARIRDKLEKMFG